MDMWHPNKAPSSMEIDPGMKYNLIIKHIETNLSTTTLEPANCRVKIKTSVLTAILTFPTPSPSCIFLTCLCPRYPVYVHVQAKYACTHAGTENENQKVKG